MSNEIDFITKKCIKCNELKLLQYFQKDKRLLFEKSNVCKLCRKNQRNPLKEKERRKKYYQNNREKILKRQKKYNKLEKVKKRNCYLDKLRKKNNPEYKIHKNVSRLIHFQLKFEKRFYSIFNFLPYTVSELKKHLENKWQDWMTWDNYGRICDEKRTWQIDHIIPRTFLPYFSMEDPNFIKCWSLDNLRPLDSRLNVLKRNTIGDEI
jgi:hypothetical protein